MSALDHILRSQLPWRRDPGKTECGRDADDVTNALTYDEALAKFRSLGQQRAIMTSCVTCFQTANARHRSNWDKRPSAVMQRETEQVSYWNRAQAETLLDRELRAIAALIEAHRDEFDAYVSGLEQTASLADRRRSKRVNGGPNGGVA